MRDEPILLVDDEDSIHLLYKEELEDEGYKIHSALTGEEALAKFPIVIPDIVLLDINMPGINGIEALRRMKEANPEIPIFLVSAYQEFKHDVATWCADQYIVKSSSLNELIYWIDRYVFGSWKPKKVN